MIFKYISEAKLDSRQNYIALGTKICKNRNKSFLAKINCISEMNYLLQHIIASMTEIIIHMCFPYLWLELTYKAFCSVEGKKLENHVL